MIDIDLRADSAGAARYSINAVLRRTADRRVRASVNIDNAGGNPGENAVTRTTIVTVGIDGTERVDCDGSRSSAAISSVQRPTEGSP